MNFDDATLSASANKIFSSDFDGAVTLLNKLYVVIPNELRSIAFLSDSSEILFALKKKSNCSICVFQSSSFG